MTPAMGWSALLPPPDSCVQRSAARCSPPGKDQRALSTPAGAPAHFSPGLTPMGFPWSDLHLSLRRETRHSSSSSNLNLIPLIAKKKTYGQKDEVIISMKSTGMILSFIVIFPARNGFALIYLLNEKNKRVNEMN